LRGGVPEGHGAAGGGCSGHFAAASWQQDVTGFASVGCGSDRAVADVAADADPYTGVAVYDSTEYEGSRGWATIGGTSVSSPVVASVFALAGGAHGVAYPASTLYENDASGAAALHDVTAGSNGECRKRVNEETGEAKCTAEEEARSCAGQAICLARSGYDGPSGVGSPNGIGAFQLASEQTSQPSASPGESTAAAPSPSGSSAPGSSSGAATSTPGAGSPAAAPRRMPALSALKLTRGASAAIRKARARLSRIGFSFTLNVPARLRVSIAKRVRARGRLLWRTIGRATIVVHGGVQTRSMSVRSKLARGRYRLTLAPDGGTARSLLFTVA
jgi:hypothetical protein